jgi:hypothetical protein
MESLQARDSWWRRLWRQLDAVGAVIDYSPAEVLEQRVARLEARIALLEQVGTPAE